VFKMKVVAASSLLLIVILLPGTCLAGDRTDGEPDIAPYLTFIADGSDVYSGGIEGGPLARWLLDAGATFDLEALIGLQGGTLFTGVLFQEGDDGSERAGDIQAYSNIDAGDYGEILVFWYQQVFREERFRLKAGRIDTNEEFAVVESAGEFLNSSVGYSPTIIFPTYPEPEYGLNLFAKPLPSLHVGAGVFERRSAVFLIAEAVFRWESGVLRAGLWRDGGELPRFDDTMKESTAGLYAVLEQELRDGIHVFAQYGTADEAVFEIASHYSLGLATTGPFRRRPDDTAGLMVTRVDLSDHPQAGFDEDETAFELFYGLRVNDHLAVKPDLQYIMNPSGDTAVDDALVGTIRLEI
jgi:carbohydrate-selective porin OprB